MIVVFFAQTEMLFCSTLVGMPFLIPPMVFTGELFKAWDSCSKVVVYHICIVKRESFAFFSKVRDTIVLSCSIPMFTES